MIEQSIAEDYPEPEAQLARTKKWIRRLWVVIVSAVLTCVACLFFGLRIGRNQLVAPK